ncbi:class I glutamine amidotransferase-like protein [Hysterangium stoloniferum]|nr:class I glutamine amidotransferase-like protein [Hysterangium stoloniferum]
MVLRLALLLCDTPIPAVLKEHGDYLDIFTRFLKSSLPDPNAEFILDAFDVVNRQEYPSPDTEYHGIILTGSAASAYADLPWISLLVSYIKSTAETKPQVKIIGICFGHQVISRAFGGECVPNNGVWEVGTTDVELTDKGKEIFGMSSIVTDRQMIQQMHRDHVPSLPPKFILLGSTSVSPVQGMILPCKDNASQVHVFCVQGHPEFLPDIVNKIVDAREKSGNMNADTVKDGRARAVRPDDGTGAIGRAIWQVLGIN